MIIRSATHFILLGTLVLAVGCESDISRRVGEHSSSMAAFVPQDEARQRAFSYRLEAQALREMARQIETEVKFSGARYKLRYPFVGGSACSGEGAFGIGRKRR